MTVQELKQLTDRQLLKRKSALLAREWKIRIINGMRIGTLTRELGAIREILYYRNTPQDGGRL